MLPWRIDHAEECKILRAQLYGVPQLLCAGGLPCETRYCMARGRRGKRFKSSDPKFKVPKWCPKRLPLRVCRVYRLKDEERSLEWARRATVDPKELTYYSASGYRYDPEPKLEKRIGYTVRQFYEWVNRAGTEDVLDDEDLEFGDIFELDDGLKPYYFYYFGPGVVLPVFASDMSRQEDSVAGDSSP